MDIHHPSSGLAPVYLDINDPDLVERFLEAHGDNALTPAVKEYFGYVPDAIDALGELSLMWSQDLLDSGPYAAYWRNEYPMAGAVSMNSPDNIQLLLNTGHDLDNPSLVWMAMSNMAYYALEKITKPNFVVRNGRLLTESTPVSYMDMERGIMRPFPEEINKILLAAGDVHTRDDRLLWYAANTNNVRATQFLLENGADVHAADDSALRVAVDKGNYHVAKLLLKFGANPHAMNDYPLRRAREKHNRNMIILLQIFV